MKKVQLKRKNFYEDILHSKNIRKMKEEENHGSFVIWRAGQDHFKP